jgi:sigma-B regulation protein RsbU (phosphoserine phosphatase)
MSSGAGGGNTGTDDRDTGGGAGIGTGTAGGQGIFARLLHPQGSSISKKILRAFLIVSILGMLTVIIAAEGMLLSLRGITEQSDRSIGATAGKSSTEALTQMALDDVETLVRAEAEIIDESLERLAGNLRTLAALTNDIYAHPDEYRELPFPHLRYAPADELSLQWALSPGMLAHSRFDSSDLAAAGVLEETFLLGNIAHVAKAVMSENSPISSLYITTASGVNIGYDSYAAQKGDVDTVELRERPWYLGAQAARGLFVSEVYPDSFERGLAITMSMPLISTDGVFRGVIAVDVNISDLERIVRETIVGANGYALLLDENQVISAPGLDEGNMDDISRFLGDGASDLIEQMELQITGVSDTRVSTNEGEPSSADSQTSREFYAVWAPVELTGWRLVMMMPKDDIVQPSVELQASIAKMTNEAAGAARQHIVITNLVLVVLALALVVLAMAVARYISKRITQPILQLAGDVEVIAEGNLEYRSNIETGDEIEELSHNFERMTMQLKDHIAKFNKITTEKERINTELNVAAHMQTSLLPDATSPFPQYDEFSLFASMDAAREIGGDFYDFFLIDEHRLALVIADVSGKGIPAALFMAIAKTLIKGNAQMNLSPRETFELANNQLTEYSDANMFVTAFMGYLDLDSGEFTYVNAGHNPPLLCRGGDGFKMLKLDPGFVLGAFSDLKFKEGRIRLSGGDTLFLYTDGVTEATSPDLKLFSEERLVKTLDSNSEASMNTLLEAVKQALTVFTAGSEQTDDITMLALHLNGGQQAKVQKSELTVDAEVSRLPEVLAFIRTALAEHGFTHDRIKRAEIAAEEVFVNIAYYAYREAEDGGGAGGADGGGADGVADAGGADSGDSADGGGAGGADSGEGAGNYVKVLIHFDPISQSARLSFVDRGVPFNPLKRPDVDVSLNAMERRIGGLGIHIIKRMVDRIDYVHEKGHNALILVLDQPRVVR